MRKWIANLQDNFIKGNFPWKLAVGIMVSYAVWKKKFEKCSRHYLKSTT